MKIPDGWTLEVDGYCKGYDVLSTPGPVRYSATLDWKNRVFRSGMSRTGRGSNTKTYVGRGWRQALLDEAVASLAVLL